MAARGRLLSEARQLTGALESAVAAGTTLTPTLADAMAELRRAETVELP